MAHGLVVADVAEAIEEQAHLHTRLRLGSEVADEQPVDGIVAEVEILHVDALLCLVDGSEEIIKLLLSAHEERHAVVP